MWVVGLPSDNFIFASTGCATQCASPYAVSKLIAEYLVLDKPSRYIKRLYSMNQLLVV